MHFNLSAELRRQQQFSEAIAEIDRSLAIYPHSANAHLVRGQVLMDLCRYKEAADAFSNGEALDAKLKVAPLFLGRALLALDRRTEAEAAWRRAIALGMTWSDPWKHLADLYLDKDPQRAAKCFQNAIDLEPDDVDAWMGLGMALQSQDLSEPAREVLEEALQRFPEHPQVRFNLAMIYLSSGQMTERAESLLRAAYPKSSPEIRVRIKALLAAPKQ